MVTPSVTRAGVPSGGIQKLWCGVNNSKFGPSRPENTKEYLFVSLRLKGSFGEIFLVFYIRPDPGHSDNQYRRDVGREEKMT